MLVIVGGVYTVTVKLDVAVKPPPSVTVNVMVVIPLCPFADVTVTVREAPHPLKTIFAVGTSDVLLEAPFTVKDAAEVTLSPTVKHNAPVDAPHPPPHEFNVRIWLAIDEMVGGA
jgi:hypothetical protein